MGATLAAVEQVLEHVHREGKRPLKILDVGCQNLYLADAAKIVGFFQKWAPACDSGKVLAYANMIWSGSEIDPVLGGLNGAWLGDLLSKAGFEYRA